MPAKNPQDPRYYENERPEIARLVDADAMRILDVGCGSGNLGASLKRMVPGRVVYGAEYVPEAAADARTKLDDVFVGDIGTIPLAIAPGSLDCIIFADILEHLTDPLAVVRRLTPYLRPGGAVVTSIPNMRHYTVFLRLARRGWVYDDFGHFDRTHFRFFSLVTMRQLLEDAGLRIESVTPKVEASLKLRALNALCLHRLEEFVAFQYLLKARTPAR